MAAILALKSVAPSRVVDNAELAQRIAERSGLTLPAASLDELLGVRERRWAGEEISAVDLAVSAAAPVLGGRTPDVIIAAAAGAAGSGVAPAARVAEVLGVRPAQAVDVRSGCRAFLDGLRLAQAFVEARRAEHVLVVSGCKQSTLVESALQAPIEAGRSGLTVLTYGDAGAAALVGPGPGLSIREIRATPQAAHQGGESESEPQGVAALRRACAHLPALIGETCAKLSWSPGQVDCVVGPQISVEITRWVAERASIPVERCAHSLEEFGNTGAASIPLTLERTLAAAQGARRALLVAAAAGVGGVVVALERGSSAS